LTESITTEWQPAINVLHVAGALIEYSRRKSLSLEGDLFRIEVFQDMAILCIISDGKLQLANSLDTVNAEDLIFYVLYTLNKLDISTEIQTEISGEQDTVMALVKELGKYMSNLHALGEDKPSILQEIIPRCV
jgi:hypothetical protein